MQKKLILIIDECNIFENKKNMKKFIDEMIIEFEDMSKFGAFANNEDMFRKLISSEEFDFVIVYIEQKDKEKWVDLKFIDVIEFNAIHFDNIKHLFKEKNNRNIFLDLFKKVFGNE